MSDKFSMLLWKFEDDGSCRGYYLVKDVSILGEFHECTVWEPIDGTIWRTDEEGDFIGYFKMEKYSILGTMNDFSAKAKTNCSDYDGAHLCEKRRWRRRGCCCIGWGRDEQKIPGTCNG